MMLESTRGQKFCEKETIQTLATLFDSWPGMENDISSCNKVIKYFVHCYDGLLLFLITPLVDFKQALEIKMPGWNYDISKWQRLFPFGVPTSVDR